MKITVKYGDAVVVETSRRWGVHKEMDIAIILNDQDVEEESKVYLTADQAAKVAANLLQAAQDVRNSEKT